ncbi:MAG: hypothetical protein Q8K64_13420 [Sediminibacterium sp.]|nr:hypothetical protein [Sediminibacterium sp.]
MKTQKMSLANIQGKLSRAEMKNIMAGSGAVCHVNKPCTLHAEGQNYTGVCDAGFGGGSGGWMACGCATSYGVYTVGSNGGVSICQS